MQWVYAVADENDDDAVRTSFYLPELSAELLPLLAAYGPGEGISVQQRVEWLLLLDMLITKPLSTEKEGGINLIPVPVVRTLIPGLGLAIDEGRVRPGEGNECRQDERPCARVP